MMDTLFAFNDWNLYGDYNYFESVFGRIFESEDIFKKNYLWVWYLIDNRLRMTKVLNSLIEVNNIKKQVEKNI